MTEQPVDVVRVIYEAFIRRDVPTVLERLAPDIEWQEAEGMPYGGTYRGKQAVVENVFEPLLRDVPDFEPRAEQFIASGDEVVAIVRYTGTAKATGKRLDMLAVHVWDLHDGKVERWRQFIDTIKFAGAVRAGAPTAA